MTDLEEGFAAYNRGEGFDASHGVEWCRGWAMAQHEDHEREARLAWAERENARQAEEDARRWCVEIDAEVSA